MMNWLLMALLFSFSTKMFLFAFDYGTVNRVFNNLDYTVYQKEVVSQYWIDEATYGEVLPPYFPKDAVENATKQYFVDTLSRIQNRVYPSYEFTYGEEIVTSKGVMTGRYQAFTIHWECRFQGIYRYKNAKTFKIVKGK